MFEAGALSKHLDKNFVCPICFGLNPSDLKGPLSYFQAAAFDAHEIKKILEMINNSLGQNALGKEFLRVAFEKWWPELKADIDKALNSDPQKELHVSKTERELLEEILILSRETASKGGKTGITEGEAEKIASAYFDLVDHLIDGLLCEDITLHLNTLYVYLSKMAESGGYDKNITRKLDAAMRLLGEARINKD